MDDFNLLKFIFTSEYRLKLLFSLYESNKNIKELEHEFDKKSSNISRGLNELKNHNLVIRLPDKRYTATSAGILLVKNLENLMAINERIDYQKNFWESHSIEDIPGNFLKKVSFFHESELIKPSSTNYFKAIGIYLENIKKSSDICVILPVFSEMFMEVYYETLIKKEVHLDLITTQNVYELIIKSDSENHFDTLVKNNKIHYHIVENLSNIFFTVSDVFSSLFLFNLDESFDYSEMLFVNKKSDINDAYRFYNSYKNNILNEF